jgi:hypothetical protein
MKIQKIVRKRLRIEEVDEKLKKEMFTLFEQYYDHVDYSRFIEHLQEKTHLFVFLEKTSKKVIGFSTIFRKSIPQIAKGDFLFSGDTVIHEDYWGNKMLQKSFFWFIIESKLRSPFSPVYWMLMSKGVKTYMMMRKNFHESYPNYQRSTPGVFQNVQDKFYKLKFGQDYDQDKGLILFKEKIGSIKSTLTPPSEKVLKSMDAEFFFKANSNFLEGDELACVAEIQFKDFFAHVFKYFIPLSFSQK